ncbi:hypothetical protein FACS1894140_1230 [Spirochaetia bacterium]|nr:hypothetical protein FACS1894140_1230 [Spirochaetia bacterium]
MITSFIRRQDIIFSQWRYFKFSKEAVESCRDLIDQYNARSLRIVTLIAAPLVTLFSLYPLLIDRKLFSFILFLSTAAIELGVYVYTRRTAGKDQKGVLGFLLFFICIIAFGIYIGVIAKPEGQAVNYMLFLVCAQIVFVLDPLFNLVLNAAVTAVFSILAIWMKDPHFWIIDVANAVIASTVGLIFSWQMSHMVIKEMLTARRLEAERNRFEAESIRDELTGLGNRRDFSQRVDFFINACQRVRQTVCVIMMDVDHFKTYNDFYGHPRGDAVLEAMGGVLSRLMAEEKLFAARVGGDEFIVIWTENRISEAQRIALKLRRMIIELQISHEQSPVAPHLTASLGLYVLRGGSPDTAEDIYERADQALYAAKNHGRNCIMLLDSADKSLREVFYEDERTEAQRAEAR